MAARRSRPGSGATRRPRRGARDEARAALVDGLGRDELQYTAGKGRASAARADRGKAAALNHALRQLYPKGVLAGAAHVVAVLDDDQARPRAARSQRRRPARPGARA